MSSLSLMTLVAAQRRRVDDREALLYGRLLADVKFLRGRVFGVHMEGKHYRVGNKLMNGKELAAVAARERRLVGEEAN